MVNVVFVIPEDGILEDVYRQFGAIGVRSIWTDWRTCLGLI